MSRFFAVAAAFLLLTATLTACQGSASRTPGAGDAAADSSMVSTAVPAPSWPQRAQNMWHTGRQEMPTNGLPVSNTVIPTGLADPVNDQPVVSPVDEAYFTAANGQVVKVNMFTLTVDWVYTPTAVTTIDAAAAISLDEQSIFFLGEVLDPLGNPVITLGCLDALYGTLNWSTPVQACNVLTDCAPVVDNDGNVVVTGVFEKSPGDFYSVVAKYDYATGTLLCDSRWIPTAWITTPSVNLEGEVYVAVWDRSAGGQTPSVTEVLRFDDVGPDYNLVDNSVSLAGTIGPNCTPVLYQGGGIDRVAVSLQNEMIICFNQDNIYSDPANTWWHTIPGATDTEFSNPVWFDDGNLYLTERSVSQGVSRLVGLDGIVGVEVWESRVVDTTDCIAPCISMDRFIYVIVGDHMGPRNLMMFDPGIYGDPGIVIDTVLTHWKSSPVIAAFNGGPAIFYGDQANNLNIWF